jgi:beta-fructofuranosidase
MFICAASQEREPSPFRGCVGVAVADSIVGPYELLPPACGPVIEGTKESIYIEMERPQVIYKNGKYHLFFSCWTHRLNPKWLEQVGQNKITDHSLYWYISVVPGSEKTEMYGTNFFLLRETNQEEFIAYGWHNLSFTLGISPSSFHRAYWNDDLLEIR